MVPIVFFKSHNACQQCHPEYVKIYTINTAQFLAVNKQRTHSRLCPRPRSTASEKSCHLNLQKIITQFNIYICKSTPIHLNMYVNSSNWRCTKTT